MDMNNIFDRLSQGPGGSGNMQQGAIDNWNQMVGSAPPEKFGRATYDAIRQMDPNEYAQHVQPGVGGTDPLGSLPPQQRTGLAQSLLGELTRRGIGLGNLTQSAGIGSLDPNNMSAQDMANMLQWTQQNEPKAFGRVAAQYQDQPNILQSLLGNKALMMAAGAIGAKLLSDQTNRQR